MPLTFAHHLHFAGMNAGPNLKAERSYCSDYFLRTAHSSRRAVEQREKAVTCCLHFASAMTLEPRAHGGMMSLQR